MVYPAIQVVSYTETYFSKKQGKRSSFQSHRRGLKLKEHGNASPPAMTLQRRFTYPSRNNRKEQRKHKEHENYNTTKKMKSSPYIGYLRHAPSLRHSTKLLMKESIVCDKFSPYVGFIRHAPPSSSQVSHASYDFKTSTNNALFAYMKMTVQDNATASTSSRATEEEKEGRNSTVQYEDCFSSNDAVMLLRYPELAHYISGRLPGGTPLLSYYSLCKWFVETEIYPLHNVYNSQQQQQQQRSRNNCHDHASFDVFQHVASWFLFPIAFDTERAADDAYMENLRRGLTFLSSLVKKLMPGRHPLLICTGVQMDGNRMVPVATSSSSLYNSYSSMNEMTNASSSSSDTLVDYQDDGDHSKEVDDSVLFPPGHPLHVSVSSLAKAYHTEQARSELMNLYSTEGVTGMPGMSSEEIQRHLDVESILRLPTVVYKSKRKKKEDNDDDDDVRNRSLKVESEEKHEKVQTIIEEEETGDKMKCEGVKVVSDKDALEWSWIALPTDPSKYDEEGKEVFLEQIEEVQTSEAGSAADEEEEEEGSCIEANAQVCDAVQEQGKDDNDQEDEERCVICLECFNDGDRLRVLPCGHHFHTSCIDKWLSGSFSHQDCYTSLCPMCKKTPTIDVSSNAPSFEVGEDDSMGTMGDDMRVEGIVPSWAYARLGDSIAKEN